MRTSHPLFQLFLARLREFYREPVALFWVYVFPLLLAVGLGVAFASRKPEPPVVDVIQPDDGSSATAVLEALQAADLEAELHDQAEGRQRLRTGKTALLVVPTGDDYRYVYDEARPESVLARYWVDNVLVRWQAGSAVRWETSDVLIDEPGNRYIDFLLPGLIGLNLMGGGLWGLGFVIVDMRVRKLLKRMLATPMRRHHYLLGLLAARLVLMVPDVILLLLLGGLAFGVPVWTAPIPTLLFIALGSAAFAGIGLLVASRTEKIETVSGLINLVMLPMWLLSGVFFSSERFPAWMQPFIQALPLTQLNDGLRELMLEGASLADVAWRAAILAVWGVVSFVLALKLFRWR